MADVLKIFTQFMNNLCYELKNPTETSCEADTISAGSSKMIGKSIDILTQHVF